MKAYAPIGYYNDPEDIIDLYPNSTFKGDEADIIVRYCLDGYGAFHTVDHPDVDSFISPADASKSPDTVFTSNGEYIVVFSRGNIQLLRQGNDMHGFFIDIYKLVDVPGYEYSGLLEETPQEKDITEMTYDELYDYTLDLTKKVKEAVIELKRRDASNLM